MDKKKEQLMPHEMALQLVTKGRFTRFEEVFSYLKTILSLQAQKVLNKMKK